MKYEGLTLKFVNFIDDYRIEKTTGLLKKIFNSFDDFFKYINEDEQKEFERGYINILTHIDVDAVIKELEETIILDGCFFFSPGTEYQATEWQTKLLTLKQDWIKIQQDKKYKIQNLRTKITNDIKKSLETIEAYEVNSDAIKDKTKRALDIYLLSFSLEERLNNVKASYSDFETIIDRQQQIWLTEFEAISKKYDYANWLDGASESAGNVSFSTHVAKLTHSSIKGASSIYFDKQDESPQYLTTASLIDKQIDVSQTDNKYAPIGKLLKLKYKDENLADKLSNSDVSCFKFFATDEVQLKKWEQGFLNCFKDKNPSSHSLAKQLYFPANSN